MKSMRAVMCFPDAYVYLATDVDAHIAALQAQRTEALAEKDREIASLKQIVLRSLDMAEGRS